MASSRFAFATIKELKAGLRNKEYTASELLAASLDRFKQYDPQVGSALETFQADSVLSASSKQGSLYGIPGIVKDNICQKGRITSCASKILANYKASYDATVVTRLKEQGALLVGRANMDEFAMGSSTETSAFKKTTNPWDVSRVPGGSSGGSIAAVAAGMVPWALGSETGGSVRQPAAFCGIVGLKPTYGLISRYGLIAYASSLDQVGIATRTVHDCAEVLSAIAGKDAHDSSSLNVSPQDYTKNLDGKMPEGLRIGIVDNAMNVNGIDPEVRQALDEAVRAFEKLGAKIKRIALPTMDHSAAVYFVVSRAEAASNLARFDGVRYGVRDEKARSLIEMYSKTRHEIFLLKFLVA